MTHAFFKALLFLAAGAVILSLHHEQDIFKMGGLWKRLPISFWTFLIGTCALVALPLTSGYYSKHVILQAAHDAGFWLWSAGVLGAFLTAVYSFRLVFIAFFGESKTHGEENLGFAIAMPLIILALLSIAGALLRTPLDSVFPALPVHEGGGGFGGFVESAVPFAGVIVAFLLFYSKTLSVERFANTPAGSALRRFWFSGWGMDRLYDLLFVIPYKGLAALNKNDIVDSIYKGIILLNQGIYLLLSLTQNGKLRWYVATTAFGAIIVVAIGVLS